MPEAIGRRICIVGTSGSGKSTLAASLARRLGLVRIELDALYHEPGWRPAEDAVFRQRLLDAMQGGAWVVDGNYSRVRDLSWGQAEALVWLDYPLPLVLARLGRRTFRRWWRDEVLWNGNREKVREHFTADGLFAWALKTHGRHRREYSRLLRSPEHAHLQVLRFRHPDETADWLDASAQ